MINNNKVIKALKEIMDPDRKQDLVSLNYVTELEAKENNVTVHFKPDSMNHSSIGNNSKMFKEYGDCPN